MSDAKNVPKTINEKELEALKFWQENKIFEKSVEMPAGSPPKAHFSFYDGPPFATGLPHHGTLMAGIVKDIIPRYQTMKGNSVRRKWGWDCHGLPIENLIEKKLGLKSKKDIEDLGIDTFNKHAQESVLQYEKEWKEVIPRVGRFVDMEYDYKTMDATYTESVWWAWKQLHEKGLAYEGYKMMHICPRCETTLAQSEVGMNYEDVTDLSVTAQFELVDEPNTFLLAWTTTPWTLPGNTALALKQDAEYVKIRVGGMEGKFILAKERITETLKEKNYETLETFSGSKMIGKSYKPVFPYFKNADLENKENIWKIWHADFITLDTGTGIAHQAPAFGADDMELAKKNNIPVIKHVKMDGTFTSDVIDFVGMKVKKEGDTQSADIEIIKYLAHAGFLFEKHKIVHSYPLCWRCKTPLLNYATSSWFIDVPKMKDKLLSENQKVNWTPEHVRDGRFGKWLEGAREWAVSRTRYWGAPLPVWKNDDGEMIIIGSLKELADKNKQKVKNTYYVMRHGEAESNVAGVIDCDGDITNALTEKGVEEVKESVTKINQTFDIIVASPFLRTKQTAEIVSKELGGIEIIFDDRLRESNLGVFDKKLISEYHKIYMSLDLDTRIEGGETHREMLNRAMSLWVDLEKRYTGKSILIVTHGGPAWMLVSGASLKTDEEMQEEMKRVGAGNWMPNAEIIKLEPLNIPRDETGKVNLHRPYIDEIKLEVNGKTYTRIPDVFDCWYESGAMPFASLHYPFENKAVFEKNYPADFIAESMDQTRGWFYSLINLGVGLFDKAPYKHVICNGMINASDGKKISKSSGNYTDPMLLINSFGADAFRLYLMSSPVVKGESISFKDEDLEGVYKKCILRLENTLSLYEMNISENVSPKNTSPDILDTWIISRLSQTMIQTTKGFDLYALDDAVRPFDEFIDDLSVWYVRRSRDRLKGGTGDEDKKHALETLTYVLQTFAKVIAPVMPFIAERMYTKTKGERESVHLEEWPIPTSINENLHNEMSEVRRVVSLSLMKRIENKINVKQPLSSVSFKVQIDKKYFGLIQDELNVKEVKIDSTQEDEVVLDVTITDALQKEGDIRKFMRAIQDARKEKGLSPQDTINVTVSSIVFLDSDTLLKATCKIKEIMEDKNISGESVELSFGVLHFTIS